jgi:hypothetical protein
LGAALPGIEAQEVRVVDDLVPDDVRDFILRHVDSVSQLEALLLLRASPDKVWNVAQAASRVYADQQEIAEMFERLGGEGFFTRHENGGYQYNAGNPADAVIGRLATEYAQRLIPITNMIHSKPRRIRQFADAFKFKKDT